MRDRGESATEGEEIVAGATDCAAEGAGVLRRVRRRTMGASSIFMPKKAAL